MEKKERIDGYLKRLQLLKERNSLREVTERELLYECILANKDRINEYPLLEPQQRSILSFLCHRSQEHPSHEYVHGLLGAFVSRLTEYSKVFDNGSEADAEDALVELVNTETVLIKLVQGVVFATALAVDNFGEVVIKYFGAESMERMDQILKDVELGEKFWGDHVEHFVAALVEDAYRDIVANNKHSLTQRKAGLVLSINFDDVLGSLKKTSKKIEKTRVQAYFERDTATDEAVAVQDVVGPVVRRHGSDLLRKSLNDEDVVFLAKFVSVDQCGKDFLAQAKSAEQEKEQAPDADAKAKSAKERAFVRDQVVALAVGVDLAAYLMAWDVVRAVDRFQPKEVEAIRAMVRHFEINSLEATIAFMLQCELTSILRGFGEDEGNKILVRVSQIRRVDADSVQTLFEKGLNRIRKNKIWEQDESDEKSLLFRSRAGKDLRELLGMLQIEPELAADIARLWENAGRKVEILVLFNIQLIAKTTTNLKMRMARILAGYGIGGNED